MALGMHLVLLARHGQSAFNIDGVINGDPALDRGLSELGREEGTKLGQQIAAVGIDLCVVSQFPRAMCRVRARDGRTGTAWVEWNRNASLR